MTIDNLSTDTWAQDRLGRAEDAAFLKSFLLNRVAERKEAGMPASYVLNIDAQWGEGKSFFLARFGRMLRDDGYLVAEVNAWQDDHADDPLLSVMDAIDQAVAPLVKREKQAEDRWNEAKRTGAIIAVAAAKGAVVQIARKVIGSGVDEISTILSTEAPVISDKTADDLARSLGEILDEKGKALLATFRKSKMTIADFRHNLKEFLDVAAAKDQRLPLFVLVDELDRCRPPFAIAMLERMKHLFEIDHVVFIVATDTAQLSHSVGAVYGGGFNSEGYLSRFFNRTYYFDRVSRMNFVADLFTRSPIANEKISLPPQIDLANYLTEGFDFFGLPLRDMEQVYDILRSIATTWNSRLKLEMCLLFPMAIAHQQRVPVRFDGNFVDALYRLNQRFGGTNGWTIKFGFDNYRQEAEMVPALSVVNEFIAHSERGLQDINYSVASMHSRWVAQQLSEEFAILHQNTFHPGTALISILRRYPDMVRSAGRLLPHRS
ncbi:KAP family P-loop NTPase fold protein [Bradyrhizobium brasilense]|uniref:KAP family P-loop NTPase fold protein n=1 Tax=Bradyrhizobium brasilense TaxID=1419277 RepID=UPI0014567E53|nr:P-loop NTPase fold protein [Bradyrhizobium brasilense]